MYYFLQFILYGHRNFAIICYRHPPESIVGRQSPPPEIAEIRMVFAKNCQPLFAVTKFSYKPTDKMFYTPKQMEALNAFSFMAFFKDCLTSTVKSLVILLPLRPS
jgi:hypothetical protein